MLMLCWLYCVPFATFMYYAAAPLTVLLACFLLKRGVCRGILWQRQLALGFMLLSAGKMFLVDLQELAGDNILYHGVGFALFVISGGVLYMLYQHFGKAYKSSKHNKHNDRDLRIWANTSMTALLILVGWELFPWVGYLAVGQAPEIFTIISWRLIAAFNFVILLAGFWLSEEYYWYYNESLKGRRRGAAKVWVPSDTLWLVLPLYLIALAFGTMADDILQ